MRDTKLFSQEDLVDLFQRASGCLRVEEICDWDEARIEYSPDDIKPVPEIPDRCWGDIHDHEIGEPMATDADGYALVAGAQWHNLGGVHPADRKNAPGKDVEEDEAESDEDPIGRFCVDIEHDGDHDHAEGAGSRAENENFAAAGAFDEEIGSEWDKGCSLVVEPHREGSGLAGDVRAELTAKIEQSTVYQVFQQE